jgi:hypothetical protein
MELRWIKVYQGSNDKRTTLCKKVLRLGTPNHYQKTRTAVTCDKAKQLCPLYLYDTILCVRDFGKFELVLRLQTQLHYFYGLHEAVMTRDCTFVTGDWYVNTFWIWFKVCLVAVLTLSRHNYMPRAATATDRSSFPATVVTLYTTRFNIQRGRQCAYDDLLWRIHVTTFAMGT